MRETSVLSRPDEVVEEASGTCGVGKFKRQSNINKLKRAKEAELEGIKAAKLDKALGRYRIVALNKVGNDVVSFDMLDQATGEKKQFDREQVIYYATKKEVSNCIAKDYGNKVVLQGKWCSLRNLETNQEQEEPNSSVKDTKLRREKRKQDIENIKGILRLFSEQLETFGIELISTTLEDDKDRLYSIRMKLKRMDAEAEIHAFIHVMRNTATILWRLPQFEYLSEVPLRYEFNAMHRNKLLIEMQSVARRVGRLLFIGNGENERDLYKVRYKNIRIPEEKVMIDSHKSMLSINDVRMLRLLVDALQAMCKKDGITIEQGSTYGHIELHGTNGISRQPRLVNLVLAREEAKTSIVLELDYIQETGETGKVAKTGKIVVNTISKKSNDKSTVMEANLMHNRFKDVVEELTPAMYVINKELDRLETCTFLEDKSMENKRKNMIQMI